ncbi:MAG: Gfo/Idh/MocA family oxidoreductase [Planctomycetota bacterium]
MAKKVRVGVIGAGQVSQQMHIPGLLKSPLTDLAAIADVSEKRRSEAAKQFNIPHVFADYKDLLAMDDLDAVCVALPNFLHCPATVDALNAGKHVLCEKPMAMNRKEAEKMIAAARKKRRIFMIGQNMRFTRDTQLAKKAIASGKIGEPYHARCFLLRRNGIPRIGSWFTQKKYSGGGVLLDLGVHMLDCTLYLMDSFDVATVTGMTFAKFGARGLGDGTWGMDERATGRPYDVDDYAAAFVKMKSGKSVILEVAWHAYTAPSRAIDIYGDRGGIHTPPTKLFGEKKDIEPPIAPESAKMPLPTERMVHFVECVARGRRPICDPAQSLVVQKVLDAIYESSRSGREVRIR